MSRTIPADLAGTQAPTLEVRNHGGKLVGRVPLAKAEELIAAGLVSPIGRKKTKYLVLNCDEPAIERPWRGGNRTTERIRGDGGQIIAPSFHLKHRDLPNLI